MNKTECPISLILSVNEPLRALGLRDEAAPLTVWGRSMIAQEAIDQMSGVASLPVTMRAALMPDAHVGYGLPIGGIAALEGAIAPYMVGVDIGCRMHATIFNRHSNHLKQKPKNYREYLLHNTWFGRSSPEPQKRLWHPLLDDPRWKELPPALKPLIDVAVEQLGTSGGGNHFVEWVSLVISAENPLGIAKGQYIALISHSGSRAVGAQIAEHYSRLAESICTFLPKELQKLAYLDQSTQAQAYELAMSLAGDFARANHEIIHERIIEDSGLEPLATVENHHNYAWRIDRPNQLPVYVHRKGATPAEQGSVGIIPGSMATSGFFVEGICESAENILAHPALNSASHGSGRRLSRHQALDKIDPNLVRQFLRKQGVTLLGGGLDEAPNAYKNPHDVIAAQSDLVRVWGEFMPIIVRMASDGGRTLGEEKSFR